MKNKHAYTLIYVFISLFFLVIACNSEEKKYENSENISEYEEETEGEPEDLDPDLTLEQIYNKLNKAKFPQSWVEGEYKNINEYQSVVIRVDNFEKLELLKDGFWEEEVNFYWKHETDNYKLICFSTFSMNAKGGNDEYYLVTLDENFGVIDELLLAAYWSVSVENEYGGTSAGYETKDAEINADGTEFIISEEFKKKYILTKGGKFRRVDPLAEHIILDFPVFAKGRLMNITNNIDFITFTFDINGYEIDFNNTFEGAENKFYTFEDPGNGRAVWPLVVNENALKEYFIQYEYRYTENAAVEYDTVLVLSALAEKKTDYNESKRIKRGTILNFTGKSNYLEITLKENYSEKEYSFQIHVPELKNSVKTNFKKGDKIEIGWLWENVYIDVSKQQPKRILSEIKKL